MKRQEIIRSHTQPDSLSPAAKQYGRIRSAPSRLKSSAMPRKSNKHANRFAALQEDDTSEPMATSSIEEDTPSVRTVTFEAFATLQKDFEWVAKQLQDKSDEANKLRRELNQALHREATLRKSLAPASAAPAPTEAPAAPKAAQPAPAGPPTSSKRPAAAIPAKKRKKKKTSPRGNPDSASNGTTNPRLPENPRIPPIILHHQEDFMKATALFEEKGIPLVSARTLGAGVTLKFSSKENLSSAASHLEAARLNFHSFRPTEDKPLRVVVRGVPTAAEMMSEVARNLQAMGFTILSTTRLRSSTRRPLPLVAIDLPRSEKSFTIYRVRELGTLQVRIEALRKKPGTSQCHRCQRFNHSQTNCRAAPRCVKCAGQHHSSACSKPPSLPATCCNCNGPHPASYRGCAARPTEKSARRPSRRQQATALASAEACTQTLAQTQDEFHQRYGQSDPARCLEELSDKAVDSMLEALNNLRARRQSTTRNQPPSSTAPAPSYGCRR